MEKIKEQQTVVESGNELAALAVVQINYHLMGYFPISPSTEIAQHVDFLEAQGLTDITMVAADGEHGAFGICYGASTAGARVFNATSANGLMYALEQMPVQSHTRYPMVLNIATRAISGPLNIKCDHSDVMMTLNTGWLILFARDVQSVYDFNICAPKISEHSKVRIPIIVAFDGNITSHQKNRVQIFKHAEDVRHFVGDFIVRNSSVDPLNPLTIGAHMDENNYMDNHFQLSEAMEESLSIIQDIFDEYALLSGRSYHLVEGYQDQDAEVIMIALGSSIDTAQTAVDKLRAQGKKAGVIWPNTLRPLPKIQLAERLKNASSIIVLDRQDTYSGLGGNLSLEIKSLLHDAKCSTKVISKVYGLGGKELFVEDVIDIFEESLSNIDQALPFSYFGLYEGSQDSAIALGSAPLSYEEQDNKIEVSMGEDGKLKVASFSLRELTGMTNRIGPGHGACNGCGIFSGVNTFLRGIKGYVTILFQTGCGMVVSAGYPYTAHKVTYVHNLFQNGAATLSGVVEAFDQRKRRGEIPEDEELTFIMITGDGGADIGMGSIIGTANRNHKMIILEYDNEGYMNTGHQLSYSTPVGHATTTSNPKGRHVGKPFAHKDIAQIMAATNIPYVFTGSESQPIDLVRKAAKAQWYAKEYGMAYGVIMTACPLNWKSEDRAGTRILDMAVKSKFFPLYEVEQGITNITYDSDKMKQTVPVNKWLGMMGKSVHLLKEENKEILESFQKDVDLRWDRLKAKHEHPQL